MTGRVIETSSKRVRDQLRHFLVIEFKDLRYIDSGSELTVPLDESNGACVGDEVELSITPKGDQKANKNNVTA